MQKYSIRIAQVLQHFVVLPCAVTVKKFFVARRCIIAQVIYLQAYFLSSVARQNRLATRLAAIVSMRRLRSFSHGGWAARPASCSAHTYSFVRRCAPTKLAIYPSENAPYSVAFIGESSTLSISHFAYARDKSGVASPRFPAR